MNNEVITIIKIKENDIRVICVNKEEYVSLTDLAKYKNSKNPSDIIKKWLSNYDTIEFLGLWEELNNINFNLAEFSLIKSESPKKAFTMTPSKWCTKVNAIGITYDKGKYSVGTFAHIDIALEFASWIDNLFKLYLIKEFKRLKRNEALKENTTWNVARILSKMNYLVHTDAIKNYIIPTTILEQKKYIYEEEDDVLNVALFGMTAKEWKAKNPELAIEGNIRDNADLLQLIILIIYKILMLDLLKKKYPKVKD